MLLDSPRREADGGGPEGWTMDIAGWLGSLSLTRYEPLFRERRIDGLAVGALTEDDLEQLGIPIRDRRRLLRAIEALNARAPGLHPAKASTTLAFQEVALAAQRRQLTVMFCDLVGSTELAGQLDPEDLDDLTRAYHRACATQIERAGGYVAKYMGDGVLAYFGYPQAHEDDAERAVHAAMTVSAAVAALPSPTGLPLAARIGIATGLVVVGEVTGAGASEERSVAGVTPNLAARLQAAAPPGGVVVSEATRRLAAALFDFRDMGPVALKGFDAGEAAWQVVGAKAAPDRFRARNDRDPTVLVGRDGELQLILDRFRRCAAGQGQVVGLAGEPGIGKSRLIHEVQAALADRPHLWLEAGGAQVFRNSPFYTIAQMVRRGLGGAQTLSPEACLPALEQALARAAVRTEHALPLIAELIGAPTPDSQAPLTLSPDQRRTGLIAAVLEWLVKSAAAQPVVLVIEDLHWVDPSSMELLDQLVEKVRGTRLLLVYSTRDPAGAPWGSGPDRALCRLARLDADSLRRLVAAAAGRELPAAVLENVVSRAEGVPLFAEELTRLILDQPEAVRGREIPATLSDLLMARLDQLGPAKEISQIAAVLGAEFQLRLLAAVAGRPEGEIAEAIAALTDADLVVRRPTPGHFAFRHALIQDAAYQALLKRQRRALHRRAATLLVEEFTDMVGAQPEVLAQHWTEAGEPELAIAAWQEAGHSASRRRAYHEAEHAYRQAIALLLGFPESDRRDERELELQSAIVQLLQFLRGYGAPETAEAAARARVLSEKAGSLRQKIQQTVGVWSATSSAGEYEAAARLADQLLQLAQAEGNPGLLAPAYMSQMTTRYRTGDLIGAEEAFATGRPYFAAPGYARSPGAAAHTFGTAATVAWLLGDEAEATRRQERAMALSRKSDNPFDVAFAHHVAAELAGIRSQPELARTHAQQSLHISEEHGFPGFAAIAHVMLGRASAELGDPVAGVAAMSQGLQSRPRSAAQMSMYLTWLAEAEAMAGDLDAALATFDEALSANRRELYFRPETLRLRGQLRRRRGELALAEADLRAAVAAAKTMGATLLHARATADLRALLSAETGASLTVVANSSAPPNGAMRK